MAGKRVINCMYLSLFAVHTLQVKGGKADGLGGIGLTIGSQPCSATTIFIDLDDARRLRDALNAMDLGEDEQGEQ